MKGKNTKHTSVDYYNTLFVLFNIICTRKKINDHKNLVCDKEKFVIGNLGIWGAFSQGYMCMVLMFMSVQYFS